LPGLPTDWNVELADVRVSTHIWLGDEDIFVSTQMGRFLERTILGVDFTGSGVRQRRRRES
jgi:hypothetical protein